MSRSVLPSKTQASPDQVEQLLAQISELDERFRQLQAGLEHSHRLAMLGTIASVIAHEYNNILTPMISYAQMALANPEDAALMRKAVEKGLAGAERAASISSSLLGFACEGDERPTASLTAVVQESLTCLGRDLSKDGITLDLSVPAATLAMSPVAVQQVLLNLILNARKAMRMRGGRLTIHGHVEMSAVHLEVSDTGPGIPPQVLDRLFEPFVTAPCGGEEGRYDGSPRGTGLGLSICRDLVARAGGTIAVTSRPGEGASFRLTLPLAAAGR